MKKINKDIICIILFVIISVTIVWQSTLNPTSYDTTGTDSAVFIYTRKLIKRRKSYV